MSKEKITDLSRGIIEIVWHFGPKGFAGECCENLSVPEFMALDRISVTQDCSVQNIGQRLGFTKSGATRIVNRLERKGYVQKARSVEDGRICCVALTLQGDEVLKSTDKRFKAELELLFKKMPEKDVPHMKEMLHGMAKLLNS